MRPMSVHRRGHFDKLRHAVNIVDYILRSADPAGLTHFHDDNAGWTPAEVVGHLLDCERLFLERAHLTMDYDCPELPFPDQDEDVRKGRYNERDPFTILAEWRQAREDYLAFLATVPEENWDREGKPPRLPPFSLNDQLFLAAWHDMIHIDQMGHILSARQDDRVASQA